MLKKERSTTSIFPTEVKLSMVIFLFANENAKGNDIKCYRAYQRSKRIELSKLSSKNLKRFAFVYRKHIPKACFYKTLNLRSRSLNKRHFVYSMKMMKREEVVINKADSTGHGGNKVLPITERNEQCDTKEVKGEKKKPISRMKELLRWAASAKAEKGAKFNGRKILMFRRRGTLKAVSNDDEVCSESPKISFRWDVESCSTISSSQNLQTQIAPSTMSNSPLDTDHITFSRKKGNWITTDSEFVVLEL
ncbi:hypothetical protein Lalb_Chr03g0041901 [Lupinus albus]|uniref:Uncharacterized protein n=1 Tax=Lupinus albus TaxID=3870 RepID=A0A6A4QUI2_LUPAL|nr:hypothetical protein Lalb_Chr03g0041901 [Lupinus albus]